MKANPFFIQFHGDCAQIENMEHSIKRIEFVVDDSGKRKAVLIDLEHWGDLWENFYDAWCLRLPKMNQLYPGMG